MLVLNRIPPLVLPYIGYSWPSTGTSTQDTVEACFGPRLFPNHIGPIGYNYDFLQGWDIPAVFGQLGYSPIAGPITRLNWSFYGWETVRQVAQWSIVQESLATFTQSGVSSLLVSGTRGGATTFPATTTNL